MIKKNINAEIIAKYFISKGIKEKRPITNKKLQKLLYYSQCWNLVFSKKPLFREKIEAWVHGPAVRDVYFSYKNFSYNPIIIDIDRGEIDSIPAGIKHFLDEIWKVYGKFDADYLEILTHNEKPWQIAREGVEGYKASNNEISLKSMREYFIDLLEKNKGKRK